MTDVSFHSCRLEDSHADALASALSACKVLSRLDLSSNRITGKMAGVFLAAIFPSSITEVNMSNNPLGQLGHEAFTAILQAGMGVKLLNLSNTDVSHSGMRILFQALQVGDSFIPSHFPHLTAVTETSY